MNEETENWDIDRVSLCRPRSVAHTEMDWVDEKGLGLTTRALQG